MKQAQSAALPQALVRQAQAGDQEAFEELYRKTGTTVYRTIFSMVKDEHLTWDIHQNTYIQAYRSLDRLKNPEAFLPWLRRIAVNEAVKALKEVQPLTFTDLADDEGLPEFPETREANQPELRMDQRETERLVREILDKLPQKQRLVLGMYYYEGCSIKEIAESMGVTQGTVKTQLYLGRKKVEAEVNRLEAEGIQLHGMSATAFLVALLQKQEPRVWADSRGLGELLAKAGPMGGEPMEVTARAAGAGFFHTVVGKLTAVVLVAAVAVGGVLGYRALSRRAAPMGDYQPTEPVTLTMSGPVPAEDATLDPTDPGAETEPSTAPTEPTTEPATEPPTEPATEAAPGAQAAFPFFEGFEGCDPSILGVILNESDETTPPTPTVVWNEGNQDRLWILPRYPGSTVSAARLTYNSEYDATLEAPAYSTVSQAGDCIAAALSRPEDAPGWLISVESPEGARASWLLTRNSEYGTPSYEYLIAGEYTGEDSEFFDDAPDFYGHLASIFLSDLGYPRILGNNPFYFILPIDENNPALMLGKGLLSSICRAVPKLNYFGYEFSPGTWLWNEWYADESIVWTDRELSIDGATCRVDAADVNEIANDWIGEGHDLVYFTKKQAELYEEERIAGRGGIVRRDSDEPLHFDLHGLLVYNPTLAAKTVSISVNGEDQGEFSLTRGDFFTWIPFDLLNLPPDQPVTVETRVTETYFGVPAQAILDLIPYMSSNLNSSR